MLRPSSKFFFALISLIESKFETPPITEVEALLLARESCANRHQTKFFPPSVHYSHSPSKSFVGGSFSCGGSKHGGGMSVCGCGRGGRYVNFQCQI